MRAPEIRAELRAGGCTEEEIALFLRVQAVVRRRAFRRALRAARDAVLRVVALLA